MPIPLMLILIALIASAPAEDQLPVVAQATLDALDRDILAAQTKAQKELTRQAVDLGKQGKLDEALLVKQEAEKLSAAINRDSSKAGATMTVSAFNGTWLPRHQEDHAYTWKDGIHTGTFPYQLAQGTDAGTYAVGPDGKSVTLTFRTGKVQQFTVISPTELLDITSPGAVTWYKKDMP